MDPTDTPRAAVFNAIARRLGERVADISRFVRTGYSFEEWLNWEAFAACAAVGHWQAAPRPGYRSLGLAGCADYGDLLVDTGGCRVLVEVGLVHDGTAGKWRANGTRRGEAGAAHAGDYVAAGHRRGDPVER